MKILQSLNLLGLLIASPQPYKTYDYNIEYTKTLNEHYLYQPSTVEYRYDYWSIGPETNNSIGGPTQRTQVISKYTCGDTGSATLIKLEMYIYTEVQTNGYTYTGNYTWTSQIQLDPAFYDTANLTKIDCYWDYGWNITTFHNLFFTSYTDPSNIDTQINNINSQISTQGGSHKDVYNTVESIINNKEGTKAISESGTTPNSYAWITTITLQKNSTTPLTEQQKYVYYHSLDNYIQNYIFTMTVDGATPPSPSTNYEVIDIAGLMFTVLGMPFAWISTAFDLTLFPGTPYNINISHIFMAVIAVSIFIFIIKKVLK